MANVVIAEAVRSAVGRAHKGSLANRRPDEFAAEVIKGLLARVPQVKPEMVEDLILGCAMPEGEQGLNVARPVGLLAGLPEDSGAVTINRFCSSGLQAIAMAAGEILVGSADTVVAGGVESMTMVPMTGYKLSASPEVMNNYPSVYTPMGITAENVAAKFGITRQQQDEFAVRSQKKASEAVEKKRFADEIVTVHGIRFENGERKLFDFNRDEMPRPDTTVEGLGQLKPAFSAKGSVTAGNASPLSDGAAAALVMSEAKAKELGVKPLGYFRHFVTVGVDPAIMGIGPLPAVKKLLAKTGLTIKDIDLVEMNEAFASQAVYCQRELGIPDEKLNVNGGAIALGHPLGCTGAKLTATLFYELKKRGGRYGIVTMCIGGGQGAAGLFELAR
ncbi:thiolase family protein [Sandaracinus amylolyticus]|uniref:acetyl-CoA C-acyltransferase n=1 Tax=Sandaracinus amylolyticus TaxID=927083 RepID=A0A0F6W6S6_9BACT|nr:thiolase family protein [Sandaracinus amylolyticus]AKF08715.1 3-ketoacyl-CoA thiolase [Sandaracinus amylolyticus]